MKHNDERYDEDGKDTWHWNYGNRGKETPYSKLRKEDCKNNSKQYTRLEKLRKFIMYRAEQRGYGFKEINKISKKANSAHHLNEELIVWIPKRLHESVKHSLKSNSIFYKNIEKINQMAFDWYMENNKTHNFVNLNRN